MMIVSYVPQPWEIIVANDTSAIISQFQSGNYIITQDRGKVMGMCL